MPLTYRRAHLNRSESSFDLAGVEYRAEKMLGVGQSGKATLFTNAHQHKKVVKKPHYYSRDLSDAKKEQAYYQLAYPRSQVVIDEGHQGDYRLILPYLGVELLDHLKLLSYSEIIALLNKVIDELARLHHLGLTHYDVQLRNILINESGEVFFIDGVTHKYSSNRQTQIHDIRALARCIASALKECRVVSDQAFQACSSLDDLRECLRNPLGEAVTTQFTPLMTAATMLFHPPKRLTLKINQALSAAEKTVSDSPLKKQALRVFDEVKKAYLESEISEAKAVAYINKTAQLVSYPEANREQYTKEAVELSSTFSRRARKVGKVMLALAVATVVTAAVCFPGSLGPVLAGVFVFAVIGGALNYFNHRTSVEASMLNAANDTKATLGERLSGRIRMCFN